MAEKTGAANKTAVVNKTAAAEMTGGRTHHRRKKTAAEGKDQRKNT